MDETEKYEEFFLLNLTLKPLHEEEVFQLQTLQVNKPFLENDFTVACNCI